MQAVRELVLERLTRRESAVHGIEVEAAAVEARLQAVLEDLERRIRTSTQGTDGAEEYVPATFGIPWSQYLGHVRASVEQSLLLERAAMYELQQHPRVQVRLIRVRDGVVAEELREKLDRGADFATLARSHSDDASAEEGGLYPPLPEDLEDSPLLRGVAKMAEGELSEVQVVGAGGSRAYRIVQVVARLPARSGAYSARAQQVEEELSHRGISALELDAWMRIMDGRYGIQWLGMGEETVEGSSPRTERDEAGRANDSES